MVGRRRAAGTSSRAQGFEDPSTRARARFWKHPHRPARGPQRRGLFLTQEGPPKARGLGTKGREHARCPPRACAARCETAMRVVPTHQTDHEGLRSVLLRRPRGVKHGMGDELDEAARPARLPGATRRGAARGVRMRRRCRRASRPVRIQPPCQIFRTCPLRNLKREVHALQHGSLQRARRDTHSRAALGRPLGTSTTLVRQAVQPPDGRARFSPCAEVFAPAAAQLPMVLTRPPA